MTGDDRRGAPVVRPKKGDAHRPLSRAARTAWRYRYALVAIASLAMLGRVLYRWGKAGWTSHPGWVLECYLAVTVPWVFALALFITFKVARFAAYVASSATRLWRR